MDHILQTLEQLSFAELTALEPQFQAIKNKKDPVLIAKNAERERFWKECAERGKAKAKHCGTVRIALAKLLKPGMLLKMKGCKDGRGLREFIKWDNNDNLVCWQISHRVWSEVIGGGKVVRRETTEKTNQVTTHMADKVSWVLIDNVQVPVNKLIT